MDDLDLGQTLRGFVAGQKVFGRYTLARQLGRGGMGVVWLARDERLEQEVALKFLPELLANDLAAVADLKRETRRSLQLTHPHIVRIHDFVEDARAAAVSMEFVDGASLTQCRVGRPSQVFEPSQLHRWVEQLCEALEYAHTKARIVHRDLKPANLMIDARGDLKVADFGISATLTDTATRVSKQMGSSGTPVYMSPQQMMGEKPAATDDIYSLGATLYELLTGKPPFYTGNVLLQVQSKVPPSVAARRAELEVVGSEPVLEEWERTIASCLAKDPAQRPQSAAEVWRRLNSGAVARSEERVASRTEPPVLPEAPVPTVRASRKSGVGLQARATLAMAALVLVGLGGWYLGIELPERRRVEAIARAEVEREHQRQMAEAERQRVERELAEAERLKAEQARATAEAARQREAAARAENERRIAAEKERQAALRRETEQRKLQAVDALLAEAAQKSSAGDKTGAISQYTDIIHSSDASEDQKSRAYYGRGMAYYDRKEMTAADGDFTKAMYSNSSAGVASDASRMHNNCLNAERQRQQEMYQKQQEMYQQQIQQQLNLYQQQMQMIMSAPY